MTEPDSAAAMPGVPATRRSGARNMLTVMGGTLASRILGLARQTIFNHLFSTHITDAFNVAYRVPNLFRELLAEGALTNSIIPVYKGLPASERRDFANAAAGALVAANLVVVGLGILLAPWVIGLRMASNSNVDYALTVHITRIIWPFLTGISFSALAMALLNAEERFSATSFSPLAFSVVSIIGFLLFPQNATALAVVTALGGFAQFLVQAPSLRRYGLLFRPRLAWTPALTRAVTLMLPFSFTTGTREFLAIVLSTLLTGFPAATVTGFNNADAIFQLGLGVFAVSPALAAYPRLAEYAARQDWDGFRETVLSNLRLVLFLCAPVAAIMFTLAPSVVSALYDWGRQGLGADKYHYTLLALPPLALAIVPWGINQFMVRTFYVRQRTMEAIAINASGFLINTALYFVLAKSGFVAMNYATTATGWAMVSVYVYLLHRQVPLPIARLALFLVQVAIAASLGGLAAYGLDVILPGGHAARGAIRAVLHLSVAGGAGLIVYLGVATTLRVPELAALRRRLIR